MNDAEKESTVLQVADWIWGTIQGGFKEQQSISQIMVDAVIGMIPVVGDVTAVRDLIAVMLRLVDDPKKREEWVEWMTLVILLFALIPIMGGAIKGVGRLLLRAGKNASDEIKLLGEMIAVLNRIGWGDARKFIQTLELGKYQAQLLGKWRYLTQTLDLTLTKVLTRMGAFISDGMIGRLEYIRTQINVLAELGEQMIPEGLKELNRRLKSVQRHLYTGEAHRIPETLKSATRETEARLVTDPSDGVQKWIGSNLPHPPNTIKEYSPKNGWPDLSDDNSWIIETFSGDIHAVELAPGTRLYRILDRTNPKSNPAGQFWSYELPKSGRAWREDCAVLEDWSKNGEYVEFVVPEGGLRVWDGRIASQVAESGTAAGQVLKGGSVQVFVDFSFPQNQYAANTVRNLPRHPTDWTDHLGVNVPARGVTVQLLGRYEVATKKNVVAGRAAVTGTRVNEQQVPSNP